jgi:hypothetical protein
MEPVMPTSPYQHVATANLADTLLELALIAPAGSVKGELAFTAALLTGRAFPDTGNEDLRQRLSAVRRAVAERFLGGADTNLASALPHIDEALRLISDLPSLPAPQVRLA